MTDLSMKALDEIDKVALISDRVTPEFGEGYMWRFTFLNDRGASVIKRRNISYGADEDLWELGVLDKNGNLDYSTPITDDVEGYLTEEDVVRLCKEIAALD